MLARRLRLFLVVCLTVAVSGAIENPPLEAQCVSLARLGDTYALEPRLTCEGEGTWYAKTMRCQGFAFNC